MTTQPHSINDEPTTPAAQPEDDFWGAPIYVYSRSNALDDGFLVDVSETAQAVGFKVPTAMTRTAYSALVEWSDADSEKQIYQDEAGRLWDVLYCAAQFAKQQSGDTLIFQIKRVPRDGHTRYAELTAIKMTIGPGDDAAPVITILLPNED